MKFGFLWSTQSARWAGGGELSEVYSGDLRENCKGAAEEAESVDIISVELLERMIG